MSSKGEPTTYKVEELLILVNYPNVRYVCHMLELELTNSANTNLLALQHKHFKLKFLFHVNNLSFKFENPEKLKQTYIFS